MAKCLNSTGREFDKHIFQLPAATVLPDSWQEARVGQKVVLATEFFPRSGAGLRHRGSMSPQQAVKRMEGLDTLRHAYLLVKEK